jgi:hypothetical protein
VPALHHPALRHQPDELTERRSPGRDSGIRTTKSDYWAVALPDSTVLFVPTAKVRRLAEAAVDAGDTRLMDRGDNPTIGAIVPLAKLVS